MSSACSPGQPMLAGSSSCPARWLGVFGQLEFGEFSSSRDVARSGQSAGLLLSMHRRVSRAPLTLREAHEFSCPPAEFPSHRVSSSRAVPSLRLAQVRVPWKTQHSSLLVSTRCLFILSYRAIPPADNDQRHETRGLGLPPNRPRAPNCALLTNYQIM